MGTKPTSAGIVPTDEEGAQQIGLQYDLRQAEIKTLIDYYKSKDPDNKGLLPNQFKEIAGKFIASGLTIDPTTVFNIFDSDENGVHGRVTIREFVLGYAILSTGTTESRLRYLFALYGGSRSSTTDLGDAATHDFLTRDQLVQCLKLMQRIVSKVSDFLPEEENSEENESHIRKVADNLIAESADPESNTISYDDFIEILKESDVVMSWLDKISNVAGEHLKYIEQMERDVVELNMEREGILNNGSISRAPSVAQNMDWAPASKSSPKSSQSIKTDGTVRPSVSFADRKRKIPLPRTQKLVRRDLRMRRTSSESDRSKNSQQGKKHLQQRMKQGDDSEDSDRKYEMHMEEEEVLKQDDNDEGDDGDDGDEINAAKPFLINYEQIEFRKALGRGACATVFEGTWLHVPVAVKVFNDGDGKAANIDRLATTDEERRKSIVGDYVEEFWLLLQIRHPNCLLYMGICFEPVVCIVTELFTGGSVANYLHGPHAQKFSPSKAIEMICGVARGMYYLHASTPSILHRDLKASNILINRNVTHCVICDFGLSRQFVKDASAMHVKNNGPDNRRGADGKGRGGTSGKPGIIGTPYTMAPEIIEQREYTPAADVYSFAIVMYEMYLGRHPFPQMKPIQMMFHISQGKRPDFSDNDKIPPLLRGLIEKCWTQDPLERPSFEDILKVITSEELGHEIDFAEKVWNGIHGLDSKEKGETSIKELSKRLHNAAFHGRHEDLLRLVNRGADINYIDYDRRTALHVAAAEGQIECMRVLVRAGAKMSLDRWSNSPVADALNFARRTNNTEPVRLLRAIEGLSSMSNLNDGNERNSSEKQDSEHDELFCTYRALNAASKGDTATVKRLLDSGLDVNVSNYDRRTPLMVAASDGKTDVVVLLLDHGANVRNHDRWGNTAYHEAERGGHHHITRLIRQAGERAGIAHPAHLKNKWW